MAKIIGYNQKQKTRQKMQTVVLNINESVSEKFFWLLRHFDKSEIEVVDFDTSLEALIDRGLESGVSPLTHKEVFDGFRAKYAQKG